MSLALDYISTRDLARELLARVPTILRGQIARAIQRKPKARPASAGRFDRTVFATFTRDDGASMALWEGYRNRIKGRWRQGFWPVRVLLHLDRHVELSPALRELAAAVRVARTLPLPLEELAALVHPVASEHPNLIGSTGRHDAAIGAVELTVMPAREQVAQRVAYHLRNARHILAHCRRSGVSVSKLRMLEQGCGDGHTTTALAAIGVGESVGVDVTLEDAGVDLESEMMRQEFQRADQRAAGARIHTGDAMALPFPDNSFDVVHSTSAVEHIARPDVAFREAHRVLAPGGIAYFDVGPWFSPDGGHGLCTLDCPWGHVRLNPAEFDRYVSRHRPHEARHAMGYYRHGFQTPRRTIAEIETLVVESAFRIVEWHDHRETYRDHYDLITPELLADCRRLNLAVTVRDLMSSSYAMLLAKS